MKSIKTFLPNSIGAARSKKKEEEEQHEEATAFAGGFPAGAEPKSGGLRRQ